MAAININTTEKVTPQCYAYSTPQNHDHDGWVKIGYTERDAEQRINEQLHASGLSHITHWTMRAAYMTPPYGIFKDHDFHAYLKKLGVPREKGAEWFQIHPDAAKSKFMDFAENHGVLSADDAPSVLPYALRDEQAQAVEMSERYFRSHKDGEFLWNAKPRFGKTLSAYELCMRMGAKNILIVTNRPAIANSWYDDYMTFFGPSSGYVFVSNVDGIKDRKFAVSRGEYQEILIREGDKIRGCIEFVSLQDLKGSIYFGGEYDKLAEISAEHGGVWDVLIVDEAHEGVDTYKTDTAFNHIKRKNTLHLSGTPFKALANEKFPPGAIYNWTYADEQRKKRDWDNSSGIENPYANLPRLSLYTYRMSDIVRDKLKRGIELAEKEVAEYAFDLNEFFLTDGSGAFVHDKEVNKFLDALANQEKFPFSTPELRDELRHTFWLLNRVASAKALAHKLKIHPVFKDYEIILAAGDGRIDDGDENEKSFDKVAKAIKEHDKTITLSVGQLTTGVTVPEWTAVLMLSNMASPALYMQAAFRAQNPCLFTDKNGDTYRKKNAYVFDFDPARTLTIFEKFANDLIPEDAGEKGGLDSRRNNVRELLNFFPVYGEDEDGAMVELDAEKVLTIPRRIHAKEVVERGFMSNFLFANISGIFSAPKEIIELIKSFQPIGQPGPRPIDIDDETRGKLNLNDDNEVEVPREKVIGLANEVFGDKIYQEMNDWVDATVEELKRNAEFTDKPVDVRQQLCEEFADPIAQRMIAHAEKKFGKKMTQSSVAKMKRQIKEGVGKVTDRKYGDYMIRQNKLAEECRQKIREAQVRNAPMAEITEIENSYKEKCFTEYGKMLDGVRDSFRSEQTVKKAGETISDIRQTDDSNQGKGSIEDGVRDHLRGFSRTIPAFLMAYGDENTTLANFDSLVPEDVFWEVTANPQTGKGVTLELFRRMRDGYDYTDENGEEKHFDGHLFDEVVFNDAVQEFMKKRAELADYFREDHKEDIYDYIPPQRTNQIFTPKKVVKEMADALEEENPGCFDDPNHTFADLYMKSGLYITEIVKRLFNSGGLKAAFPDEKERVAHIFKNQVYGMAPTEILYRITSNYILGFDEDLKNGGDHHFVRADALAAAKEGRLSQLVDESFS